MYFIDEKQKDLYSVEEVDINILKCHENIIQDKLESLLGYLTTLDNNLLISSIIVCKETKTIIDGHHRYQALRKLGFTKAPVTYINYESSNIKTHFNDNISKKEIIYASQSGNLLAPKSSKHIIYVEKFDNWLPIILISTMCLIKK